MAVITQIFILFIGVAMVMCQHLPPPLPFEHPRVPGPPPYRNIFTDIVHNIANGFLGGFLGHGNGIRPGGYNNYPPPITRPGYEGEYYGNGANNVGLNVPGQNFGMNDHRGPQQVGFNDDHRFNTGAGQGGNNIEISDQNINRPQKPVINEEKDKGETPVNNYFIVVPLNPNGNKPPQTGETSSNINGASVNDASNNVASGGEDINGNVNGNVIVDTQVPDPKNNPEQQKEDENKQIMTDPDLKYNVNLPQEPKISNPIEGSENNQESIKDESIGNEKSVPGFNDEDIKTSTLMVDPEVKYNTNKPESPDNDDKIEKRGPGFDDDDINKGIVMTDAELKRGGADELDKFRNPEAIVFPNEGSQIIIENLPSRFSNAENGNQPSNNVQVTQPTPATNNPGTQNQNQNQQVSTNNGNGAPYVNGVGNSNGAYVVHTPSSTESSLSGNSNTGVSSTGQGNGPYINVVGNPNSEYVVASVPSNAGISGQSYVIPGNVNSGTINPPLVYVLSNGNSGVNNPGPSYVAGNYGANYPSPSYGYATTGRPTEIYIPYNGNSGGNPNQIYVVGNPGSYSVGQNRLSTSGGFTPRPIYVTIPATGAPNTNGGYYNPVFVPANNGQINVPVNYKPVPVGTGYQVVGNNPGVVVSYETPSNVMTGGIAPPPNVPLLISYKDDERDEDEKKIAGKKVKPSLEEDRRTDDSRRNMDEKISHLL